MFLAASVGLNLILGAAVWVLYLRAQGRAKEEKVATFAACVRGIAEGLANKETDLRWQLIATGLSNARGGLDAEEIRWRLVRASFIRLFRTEPALLDVGGEHVCGLLATASFDERKAAQVWDYFDRAVSGEEGYGDPAGHFDQKELSTAYYHYLGEIVQMYANSIRPETINPFK